MLRLLLFTLLFLGWLAPANAIEAPQGPVILTITGDIQATNTGDAAEFDRDLLRALDWHEVESYTEFTEGLVRFRGPRLASVLDALGIESGTLHATALDDYKIQIPVSDAADHGVIIALEKNGAPMRVRDKGPLWVVYPKASPEELDELHSSRMIWQLRRIDVQQ